MPLTEQGAPAPAARSNRARFEITGEWSGPLSPSGDYTRVQHREVVTDRKLVDFVQKHKLIRYTDGTALYLTARQLKKGEKKQPAINGYGSLLRDCARHDVNAVADLPTTGGAR